MYIFTEYQKNVIISACKNHWRYRMSMLGASNEQFSQECRGYLGSQNYMDGVTDALGITIHPEDGTYNERYHVYSLNPDIRHSNGNLIEVLTIDALDGRIIYDINTDDSKYSKEILKILKENIK